MVTGGFDVVGGLDVVNRCTGAERDVSRKLRPPSRVLVSATHVPAKALMLQYFLVATFIYNIYTQ